MPLRRIYIVIPCFILFIGAFIIASQGCGRRPGALNTKKSAQERRKPLQVALGILEKPASSKAYKEALNYVNQHLNTTKDNQFGDANRKLLTETFALNDREFEAVQKNRFQPLDAIHLKKCYTLHAVAKSLAVAGLSEVELTRVIGEFVARQVILQEPAESWKPGDVTLMLGEGTTVERTMLIVELLRQLMIDTCVFIIEDKTGRPSNVLIGIAGKQQVYMFDPRLASPVLGTNGKSIATWQQVKANPKLLARHGYSEEQAGRLRPRLIWSLSSISPRMNYLQKQLAANKQHVVVAVDPEKYVKRWQGRLENCKVWNSATTEDFGPNSPLRALAYFFPPEDGGYDRAGVYKAYQSRLIPQLLIEQRLYELGFSVDFAAKNRLFDFAHQLFDTYTLKTREKLIRGEYNFVSKRVDTIKAAINDVQFAAVQGAELQRRIKAWRNKVNEAYDRFEKGVPSAEKTIAAIWGEDLYFNGLISNPEGVEFRTKEKKTLTYVVMAIVQEELERLANWQIAQLWHEKSAQYNAHYQYAKKYQKEPPATIQRMGTTSTSNWANTRRWWEKYLGRYDLTADTVVSDIKSIPKEWTNSHLQLTAIGMWDRLATRILCAGQAKWMLAKAQKLAGDNAAAQQTLNEANQQLSAILQSGFIQDELRTHVLRTQAKANENAIFRMIHDRLTNLLDSNGSVVLMRKKLAFLASQ